ncbi:hypothetical protein [Microbulbifer thermotolerans]|uniref:hypothetical protein n=1 Tax=Microbulbifer thermotolerans TaxID=252514 RepID=UPI002248AC12|nr:hypothetical protein [Microbulbifer thermotolerans]MCX2778226.1 hypothetical protein [Microbulbifer thermotolerans]MCX2803567.1 hypothetical protein [Microbulbifer thermotolerans]MCX2829959.1 hypothetical protein [Microbulbifer thermotolerans]MCX2841428.1 hypothetical protein [Microbulbifer thermotolerans]WKT61482.1 hypothetical protein Q2E61_04640 [Microbulbifer thermotolerans]
MTKYILPIFFTLVVSMNAFPYSFVGEGEPGPIFEKDIWWLKDIGLEVKSKNIDFEPDNNYKEVLFKLGKSPFLEKASSVNLVLMEGDELIAVIKEPNLGAERVFSVVITKDTSIVIIIRVSKENEILDVGTYRVAIKNGEK